MILNQGQLISSPTRNHYNRENGNHTNQGNDSNSSQYSGGDDDYQSNKNHHIGRSDDASMSFPDLDDKNNYNQPLILHLELANFKIFPCQQKTSHNHKQCQFYHSTKDRRRQSVFSSDLCQYVENDNASNCKKGDLCGQSHNKVEQLYSSDQYKTQFCTLYPYNCERCQYGSFCSFAHSENDIVIELIHNFDFDVEFYIYYYQTVWCPFNYINHDRGQCVYAHNWQDFRRKLHTHKYEPEPCRFWNPNNFISRYEDGCHFKFACTQCHGWKELEYHPLNYKIKACASGDSCLKGHSCPYFHSYQEKRTISNSVRSKLFQYAPRNRIIKGTFYQRPIYTNLPKKNEKIQQMGMNGKMRAHISTPSLDVDKDLDKSINNAKTRYKGKIKHGNTYNYTGYEKQIDECEFKKVEKVDREQFKLEQGFENFNLKDISKEEIIAFLKPNNESSSPVQNGREIEGGEQDEKCKQKSSPNADYQIIIGAPLLNNKKPQEMKHKEEEVDMEKSDSEKHNEIEFQIDDIHIPSNNVQEASNGEKSNDTIQNKSNQNLVKSMINSILQDEEEESQEYVSPSKKKLLSAQNNSPKPFFL